MVNYVPELKGNHEGSWTYFTVYPDLSPNTDIIPSVKKDLLIFSS